MSNSYLHDSTTPLSHRVFAPLRSAVAGAKSYRQCKTLSDEEWVEIGVRRVYATETSGRGFLHLLEDEHDRYVDHNNYFAALKSARRHALVGEVADDVCRQAQRAGQASDPFAAEDSLKNYDIWAGDGHYIEQACHDERVDGGTFATGSFFALDMRTHAMRLLAIADRGGKRKREHDMRALKRMDIETLRAGSPTGRQTLWVWDRAGIDAGWWQKIKKDHGIYFVSRAKENMKLTREDVLPYDPSDPVNAGVTWYGTVNVASQCLRCVVYACPETRVEYTFLTSLTKIKPGIIAAIYRCRWDIEKTFDVTKNKLCEKKSWGISSEAKHIHAHMVTLAHNLMLITEKHIEEKHGITNALEEKRRQQRWDESCAQNLKVNHSPLVQRIWLRVTQRSLLFIRWLRNNFDSPIAWERLLEKLKRRFDRALRGGN